MKHWKRESYCLLIAAHLLAAGVAVAADTYPIRPIRLVIPYSVGGATDITARIIAPRVSESVGQQVIVDNRPGGASIPGTDMVAKAAPDGYAILMATSSFCVNPALFKKMPFDSAKDFVPVTLIATIPMVVAVHPSVPARSIQQLLALAKAKPGALNYGSAGNGSATHMAAELFKYEAKINIVHVPYKGGGPAVTATVAGETSVMVAIVSTVLPHFKSGRLIPLGVGTAKQLAVLPEVPTLSESGLPGFRLFEWQGIVVPTGTPAPVIQKLHQEFTKALRRADTRDRIVGLGAEVLGSTPGELDTQIKSELAKWPKVVKANGIKVD